ncbi:BatD family protein [Marinobacter daqiaonensis]|nr:BatD family protein [Marinobacter daqiaonensis]
MDNPTPASRLYRRAGRLLLLGMLALLPALAGAQDPRETHIELAASDDQVYVQQQLLVTVRLFYSDNIVRGELSRPEHPDAVIEEAGEQRQYRERRNGTDYRVVERRYAIFPQSPGPFQLPTIEFEGLARHDRGHVYRLSDSATLFEIHVRDIPAGFSGGTWLPAQALTLSDEGVDPGQAARPGENLTRTLKLRAEGLPASVLPPLEHQYPDALRSYPEPANRQASIGPDGMTAILEQTVALVPVPGQAGEVQLPAMRIPWWDVTEDREKVAVLPARTLMVAGDPATPPGSREGKPEVLQAKEQAIGSNPSDELVGGGMKWGWYAALAVLAAGWSATALAWWFHARRHAGAKADLADNRPVNGERPLFKRLEEAAKSLDPEFFTLLPRWTAAVTGRRCTTTGDALAELDSPELSQEVVRWQEHLFRGGSADRPDPEKLLRHLRHRRGQPQRTDTGSAPGHRLPRLYPPGIEPGGRSG